MISDNVRPHLDKCYKDALAALKDGPPVGPPEAYLQKQLKLFAEIGICDSAAHPVSHDELRRKIDARLLPVFVDMRQHVVNVVLEPPIAESYSRHGDGFLKCSHEVAEDALQRMLYHYLDERQQGKPPAIVM